MLRESLRRPWRALTIGAALVLAVLPVLDGLAHAQPRVVASIAPAHALVAGVMEGVGEPVLLVEGVASPHSYALRPSEAVALHAADLVFWVGPAMETFLVRPLGTLGDGARVVALAETPGVERLPLRTGGLWDGDDGHAHTGHADTGHEGVPTYNPHVWLDPHNARAMVRAIAAALADVDAAHAARYAANAKRLQAALAALDTRLEAMLAPVRTAPFLVFHDAYRYLEHRYGLNAVGAVTVSPEQPPGARRIATLRERLRNSGAVCLFAEPQFEPRLVRTLVEGTDVRVSTLDPLGASLQPGPGLYETLMLDLARSLTDCLAPRG